MKWTQYRSDQLMNSTDTVGCTFYDARQPMKMKMLYLDSHRPLIEKKYTWQATK